MFESSSGQRPPSCRAPLSAVSVSRVATLFNQGRGKADEDRNKYGCAATLSEMCSLRYSLLLHTCRALPKFHPPHFTGVMRHQRFSGSYPFTCTT